MMYKQDCLEQQKFVHENEDDYSVNQISTKAEKSENASLVLKYQYAVNMSKLKQKLRKNKIDVEYLN